MRRGGLLLPIPSLWFSLDREGYFVLSSSVDALLLNLFRRKDDEGSVILMMLRAHASLAPTVGQAQEDLDSSYFSSDLKTL